MRLQARTLISKKILSGFTVVFLTVLLINSGVHASVFQGYPRFRGEPSLQQQQIHLPQVKVTNITTAEEFPEENKPILTTITIENNDTTTYPEIFQVYATLTEIILSPHSEEKPTPVLILNTTAPSLPAKQSVQIEFSFTATLGQYSLTVYLAYNNTMLPNSDYTIIVQVISEPIGSVTALMASIGVLLLVALLTLLLPGVIDKIRLRKYKKINHSS